MATTSPVQAKYETVIGLEVHVQLNTNAKLFDPSPNAFGDEPNVNVSPVCLGLPGALPVLNEKAVAHAIKLGLALNCQIAEVTRFDRKQYFYPDLPKGYQISQLEHPISVNGFIELSNGRKVRIERAHMEEDAGKLVHAGADGLADSDYSLVDLNRAGAPLVEVVSAPDMRSAEEAREYMMQLRNIVRYIGVCDGNLEEGSMRCDANVSIRPVGSDKLGTKVEIKNMNSFSALQRAIENEVERQVELTETGGKIVQETRLWNEATQTTKSMRSKEEANDYRYFPDPDLRPLVISRVQVEELRTSLPELPAKRLERLTKDLGIPNDDAMMLVDVKELGDCFDEACKYTKNHKGLSNWLIGEITAWLKNNKKELPETKLSAAALAEVTDLFEEKIISSAAAKKLLHELLEKGGSPKQMVEAQGLAQVSDEGALKAMVEKVFAENPKEVEAYKGGKTQLVGFFVGQVVKASKGSANPQMVSELVRKLLS